MFEIPDWEEDIPKSKSKLIKRAPKEKNKPKKNNTSPSIKQNEIKKPNFKSKKKLHTNPKKVIVNHVNQTKNTTKSNVVINNGDKIITKPVNDEMNNEQIEYKKLKQNKIVKAINEESNTKHKNYYDTDNLDELLILEKKKKLNKVNNDCDDVEKMFHEEYSKEKNIKSTNARKKELIKTVLQKESHRRNINISNRNPLRERMLERLKAAKFRFLNEKLYTSTGADAQKLFEEDPTAFQTYHEGYQQQMKKWPVKPLDVIIKRIQKMPKSYAIADMGCGEAELARRVPQRVRSFDLVARAPAVEACDVTRTPLCAAQTDAAVYCLALMGTELTRYLLEANRVLRVGGHLLIAEVESRFDNVDNFVRDVQKLGFSLKKLDKTHEVFYFMEFTKIRDPPVKKSKLPMLKLKPCIYKKR